MENTYKSERRKNGCKGSQKAQKHIDGRGGVSEHKVLGANIQILRKKKILKKSFLQVCCDYHSVFGLSFAVLDAYIRAHVRVRAKNAGKWVFLCIYYAMEYQKIRFKPLFSVIQREKTKNGIVIG